MIRESAPTKQDKPNAPPTLAGYVIEARMLSHLLYLHTALLEVGLDQLREPPPADAAGDDLAQRITAVFRRTLPALRIANKWIRANFSYLKLGAEGLMENDRKHTSQITAEDKEGKGSPRTKDIQITDKSIGLALFWDTYAKFSRMLSRRFPADRLPAMVAPLDEDVEMRGFLPLKKMMGETQVDRAIVQGRSDGMLASPDEVQPNVHPNVLQLMRIADLMEDASVLAHLDVGFPPSSHRTYD
jgi:hypothetical protein